MSWNAKYLESSLFYEPWKTKFIEVFCRIYPKLNRDYLKWNLKNTSYCTIFVENYFSLYTVMLKILKKKLESDGNNEAFFCSEIINKASEKGYIRNKKTYFELLSYMRDYYSSLCDYRMFKSGYMVILKDFLETFKHLVKNGGFRDKECVIYDNSCCLWGIKEQSYRKIIKFFMKHKNIKIVRICGSRVTDSYREFSDIDLISEGTYSRQEYEKIAGDLRRLEIPYIIDMNDIFKKSKAFMYRNTVKSNILYDRDDYFNDDYVSILDKN